MPRIEPLLPEDVGAAERAVLDTYYRNRGNVPNMYRTLALRPEIMTTAAAHMSAVLNSGTVPLHTKELLIVRVSQLNACRY